MDELLLFGREAEIGFVTPLRGASRPVTSRVAIHCEETTRLRLAHLDIVEHHRRLDRRPDHPAWPVKPNAPLSGSRWLQGCGIRRKTRSSGTANQAEGGAEEEVSGK